MGREQFLRGTRYKIDIGGESGSSLRSSFLDKNRYTPEVGLLLDKLPKGRLEHISLVKFRLSDIGIGHAITEKVDWGTILKAVRNAGLDPCPQLTAPEIVRQKSPILGFEDLYILSETINHIDWKQFIWRQLIFKISGRGVDHSLLDTHWITGGLYPSTSMVARFL